MKDYDYENYKRAKKRDSKYDTGKIPLTNIERERHEQINRQRYEQAVRNQEKMNERRHDTEYAEASQREYDSEQHTPQKKKKKGCGCTSFFVSIFLVIVLLFVGVFGYGYSLCSKTDYQSTEMRTRYSDSMSDPKIYNVLLIGADKENDGSQRSDSMILLSIDSKTKTLKFTSFMRDMWVEIPEHDDAKLNAAFSYGGAELLMKTIERNFKIRIDNYIMVDFDMFKELIDALGGVQVDITAEEARFINRTTHAKVTEGINDLNGDYALIYCRIRKLDSDFNRTQRQRKVMTALLKKAMSQNVFTTISAAKEVLPLIKTDINPLKMTFKALGAVAFINYSNDQFRLPIDGGYKNKTIHSQSALAVDFEENIEALQEFIYG